jgi:O-antigen chain-terminating methyltransferase
MSTPPFGPETLARLRRERQDADRLYNDALTALDRAIQRLRELPHPPPPYDEFQVTPLNERWELLRLKPADRGGWLRRLRVHLWGMVAPLFERQESFNAALVDHVNRNVTIHRETTRAIDSTLSVLREELERLVNFQSTLVLYAQQVTPYVDTKDREVAGLVAAVSAGLGALGDEVQKRGESALTRARRYDAQLDELRGTLSLVQRATQTLKRELERRAALDEPAGRRAPEGAPAAPAPAAGAFDLNAYKYVGFEDQFRGAPEEIRERTAAYVPYFEGARDVLDIGCGRGEFLDLLREHGIPARGVDLNEEMAAICRERGLDAAAGDALSYLRAQPDGSLGGLFAAQVVEHLEPDYLMALLEVACQKLRPGARIVLETINPACWAAFFSSYIRDISHVQPLHPDTLQYLLVASGFQRVEIRYSAPAPEEWKLQTLRVAGDATPGAAADPLPAMAAVFNENVGKLNGLLFTYLDYAAIGERP